MSSCGTSVAVLLSLSPEKSQVFVTCVACPNYFPIERMLSMAGGRTMMLATAWPSMQYSQNLLRAPLCGDISGPDSSRGRLCFFHFGVHSPVCGIDACQGRHMKISPLWHHEAMVTSIVRCTIRSLCSGVICGHVHFSVYARHLLPTIFLFLLHSLSKYVALRRQALPHDSCCACIYSQPSSVTRLSSKTG